MRAAICCIGTLLRRSPSRNAWSVAAVYSAVLSREARVLHRYTSACRAVTAATRRQRLFRNPGPPDALAEFQGVLVARRAGFGGLAGIPGRDVAPVLLRQRGGHAVHDRVLAGWLLLACAHRVVRQLLDQIVSVLLGQDGIGRDRRVAVAGMARRTDLGGDLLSLGSIRFGGRLVLRMHQCRHHQGWSMPPVRTRNDATSTVSSLAFDR